MALTQEQGEFFAENGYLAYGSLLDAAEVEALRREYDAEFRKAREEGGARNLSADGAADAQEKTAAPTQMLQIMQMCERNLHFRRLIYDRRILDLVQNLIGPNIMLFHDQALFKPARTGGAVFWHQDNAYWRCSPPNLVSCWLTLDDARRENGAMQVIPGSHHRLAGHQTSQRAGALLESRIEEDGREPVVVELAAGGCMFHHCQTLHYTPPNETECLRRAFAIHYMPPGTRGRDGEIIRVDFHHPMLRMSI
jgi:ectoine hydroxylase-related dioxygenase (phytanoyl-CoA dioxygenase family)